MEWREKERRGPPPLRDTTPTRPIGGAHKDIPTLEETCSHALVRPPPSSSCTGKRGQGRVGFEKPHGTPNPGHYASAGLCYPTVPVSLPDALDCVLHPAQPPADATTQDHPFI